MLLRAVRRGVQRSKGWEVAELGGDTAVQLVVAETPTPRVARFTAQSSTYK